MEHSSFRAIVIAYFAAASACGGAETGDDTTGDASANSFIDTGVSDTGTESTSDANRGRRVGCAGGKR